MEYELRAHTADVAVAASGDSLGETFAATATGMAEAMCEEPPDTGRRHDLTVAAEGLEALLFDYLDELIYDRDVRGVLPVAHEVTVSRPRADSGPARPAAGELQNVSTTPADPERDDISTDSRCDESGSGDAWTVSASYRGVPLEGLSAREIKAVTYSEMELERSDTGWRAYVVFDV